MRQYDRAITSYDQAIKLNPDYAKLYFLRGHVYKVRNQGSRYKNKDDYKIAIADYTKAIELIPDNANFYKKRGKVYLLNWDFAKALADYWKAFRLRGRS